MKLTSNRNVESTFGTDFKSNNFTVAVTGKTFDLLLDKLYEHKIPSIVRELWTNAYDAHVAAGVEDQPFFCQLPTPLDPVFTVRDYGISMTPDETMHLYTQVFASTKTEGARADDFVGALGLGSKSPFAYTDAFQVTVWLDGVKRVYMLARDGEGIPVITLLTTEDSGEPRGVEVSLPVQAHHFNEFREAARKVSRGFTVKPTTPGMEYHNETPLFEGENWRVYEQHENAIRQGCVIYPIHDYRISTNLNYGYGLVVDVAIGTAQVAMNRESLSLDDDTLAKVVHAIELASNELDGAVYEFIDAAVDIVEANRRYNTMAKIFRLGRVEYHKQVLNGVIELDKKNSSTPQDVYDDKNKPVSRVRCHVDNLDQLRFVIDRTNNSVPRKTTRLREWKKTLRRHERDFLFLLKDPTSKQLATLMRRFQLNRDQLIPIASLPDVKIERAPRGSKKKGVVGVYDFPMDGSFPQPAQKVADDYLYLECPRIDGNYMPLGKFGGTYTSRITAIHQVAGALSKMNNTTPVYLMTPGAVNRLKPGEEMSVLSKIEEWIEENKEEILDEYKVQVADREIRYTHRIYNNELVDKLLADLGPAQDHVSASNGFVDTFVSRIDDEAVSDAREEAVQYVADLVKLYPLVFGTDDQAKIDYVDQLRNSLS